MIDAHTQSGGEMPVAELFPFPEAAASHSTSMTTGRAPTPREAKSPKYLRNSLAVAFIQNLPAPPAY